MTIIKKSFAVAIVLVAVFAMFGAVSFVNNPDSALGFSSAASIAHAFSTGGDSGCCGGGFGGGDGGDNGDNTSSKKKKTSYCEIDASDTHITEGESVTLYWDTNYSYPHLYSNPPGSFESIAKESSRTVYPTKDTTYKITYGQLPYSICEVKVYVEEQPETPVCTISAHPEWVEYKGSTTLTWESSHAHSATLSTFGSVAVDGSKTVSHLTHDKTYTLTVVGDGGTATCSTSVEVGDKPEKIPSCWLSLSPQSIEKGDSTTLTWGSHNAVSAHIDQNIGSVNVSGSRTLYPHSSRTYTMTVTSETGHTATCSKYVTVNDVTPAPTCTIDVSPSSIYQGDSAHVSWTSHNAHTVTINQGIGHVSSSGSRTVYPYTTTTYTATVIGDGGTATCSDSVGVLPKEQHYPAPTCTIWANPSSIQSGSYTTLSWSSHNATSAWISELGSVSTSGSRSVSPYNTRSYTMTVYGHNGQTRTCNVTVGVYTPTTTVVPVPPQQYVSLTYVPYTGSSTTDEALNMALFASITVASFASAGYLIYRRREEFMTMFGFSQ